MKRKIIVNIKNLLILFLTGGVVYGFIEVLWRGFTHPAMFFAGGLSAIALLIIAIKMKKAHFLYRVIMGSLSITAIELVFGLVFNVTLQMKIWDYSALKFNFLGQICILFTVIWGFLCVAAIPLTEQLFYALQNRE